MRAAGDEQLVREAQRGSTEAFEVLVTRYEPRVTTLCRRILGSPADAEDAAVSAFVKAWGALDRYDCRRSFAVWLLTIAAREEAHALRRALARLTGEARTAVALRYQLDWSYAQIAEALRLPVGTVGTLLAADRPKRAGR